MTVIAIKADNIYCSNETLVNLRDYEKSFTYEALVINYVKCVLMKNEELDDFFIDGISVNVYRNNYGYDLYFEDYKLELTVYGKQIVDFSLKRI